jgi:hypothetical protein
MTTRQAPGATLAPIAATLNTPPWARAETPQGRSQAESRRTADREAFTTPTRKTPPQVSAGNSSAQGSSIMTRGQRSRARPAARGPARLAAARCRCQPCRRDSQRHRPGGSPVHHSPAGGQVPHQPARLAQCPVERATAALGVATAAGQDGPAQPMSLLGRQLRKRESQAPPAFCSGTGRKETSPPG